MSCWGCYSCALENKCSIGISTATLSARRLPPQQRDALHGNLGGWDPLEASLADAYSGISTPGRQAGSTPPLAAGRADSLLSHWILHRGPASCPGAPNPTSAHSCWGSVCHEVQRPQSTQLAGVGDLPPAASRQDVPLHPPATVPCAALLTL